MSNMVNKKDGKLSAADTNISAEAILDKTGQLIDPATDETLQSVAGFNIPKYDYVSVDYSISTQETYTFKSGGSGGTLVATLVVVYTDATKANISTVTKT